MRGDTAFLFGIISVLVGWNSEIYKLGIVDHKDKKETLVDIKPWREDEGMFRHRRGDHWNTDGEERKG